MDKSLTRYNVLHKKGADGETSNQLQLCRWHKEAISIFGDVSGKKIVEVGCGRGDFSIYLSEKKAIVIGTDFSDVAVDVAKEKAKERNSSAEFSVADAQHMPFEDNYFDVLYSCECLEHIPNPQKALKEFYRILKPGGKAIITTENYSNGMIISWLQTWITKKPFNSGTEVQPIENFFLYWKVKKWMTKNSFRVQKITGWHYVFLILPRSLNWIKEDFKNAFAKQALKPFARHMTFLLHKEN